MPGVAGLLLLSGCLGFQAALLAIWTGLTVHMASDIGVRVYGTEWGGLEDTGLETALEQCFGLSWDAWWHHLSISHYFVRLCDLGCGIHVVSASDPSNQAASWDEGRRFLLEINALEAVFCAVSRSPSRKMRTF